MSSDFMAAVTICSHFWAQEEEICHCFHLSPFCLPCSNGTGCHDLSCVVFFFLIFSLKLALSVSFFTLINRLFSSSSLSAIRVISSAYLRLLIFLQARTMEWVAISFSNAWKWKVKVRLLSRVRLFATPWTAAHQAPPSVGFSRQEYWSGVP